MTHPISATRSLTVLCFLLAAFTSLAVAPSYTISATANVYSAGLSTPVDPGGSGAGILPTLISIAPGESAFQFSASGSVTENNLFGIYHGPDGRPGVGLNVLAYGGLAGFRIDQTVPLAGVFLSGAAPSDPAPATLDFTDSSLGLNFTSLSPQIGQVFFIGDGQTDGASTQTFYIPAGATRLFLGFPDAPFGDGLPGAFDDNDGSVDVMVTAVPEPTSALTGAVAFAFLTAFRFKSRKSIGWN